MATSQGTATVKANGGLNVRKGAGTNYAKIGSLQNGAKVTYYGEQNGWLQIKYDGKTGYISKQYTTTSTASSGGSSSGGSSSGGSSSTAGSVKVTASSLNVRKGPGTGNAVIGSLSNGTVVSYSEKKDGWLKISYKGQVGWISETYTTKATGGSTGGGSTGGGSTGGGNVQAPAPGKLNPHTKNYKQYASPWGPKMYSNHNDKSQTYKSSACGPTACASIIAAKGNSSVTPYTLGTWAVEKGYRTYNDGTAHSFVPAVAKKYGMTATSCSVETGVKKLQAGHYCVAAMKSGYWTSGGHYITPYASDGSTIYVDDPGHSSRPNGFKQSKSQFAKECNAMWYFS